jgi:hypothetical protein
MNTTQSRLLRKFVLAAVACAAITVVGTGNGLAWDHDHYYSDHHYYHHEFVWFHHHRGYWEHRDGVTFFVNVD